MALIRLEQIAAPLSLDGDGLHISGGLVVESGSAIFYQSTSSIPAVTIYGDTVIHDQPGISSASLTIDNIDTLGDETTPQSVDLGTF
jgi:hypothetical protein